MSTRLEAFVEVVEVFDGGGGMVALARAEAGRGCGYNFVVGCVANIMEYKKIIIMHA